MLKKWLKSNLHQRQEDRYAELERNLIRREAKIGGRLFGRIPTGHNREFFCLDEHTWVWHEEWADHSGPRSKTVTYSVRPGGIIKTTGDNHYQKVSPSEAYRLYQAAKIYQDKTLRMYQASQPV